MGRLPNLEIVANFGVGYDSVDAAWAGQNGVVVSNTPDVLTEEVADTALGLLLMTVRELSASERYLRAGHWVAKGAYPLTHGTLRGKTIGILALGRIGKAIARRCEAFGLTVVYHGRSKQADVAYRYYPSLVEMAKDVDILLSVAPGGPDTHHIINAEVLKALGPQGVLVNIGRGSVVDEPALIKALQDKTIASAGLDVFEHEPKVPARADGDGPHRAAAACRLRIAPHPQADGAARGRQPHSWFSGKGPVTPVAETPWPPRKA